MRWRRGRTLSEDEDEDEEVDEKEDKEDEEEGYGGGVVIFFFFMVARSGIPASRPQLAMLPLAPYRPLCLPSSLLACHATPILHALAPRCPVPGVPSIGLSIGMSPDFL